eukprot:c19240_g1_i2.p1 GENE.c19240_g1_i2~~c19240_g1_i2.p1  ORF type:complete len:293 (-),score=-0.68 c19240_g1_i2:81-959(-)
MSLGQSLEEFRKYFEKFGTITDAVVMKDHTGNPRGFGFVTYDSESTVEEMVNLEHKLGDKAVEVKKAEPKPVRGSSRMDSYERGYSRGGPVRREPRYYDDYASDRYREPPRRGRSPPPYNGAYGGPPSDMYYDRYPPYRGAIGSASRGAYGGAYGGYGGYPSDPYAPPRNYADSGYGPTYGRMTGGAPGLAGDMGMPRDSYRSMTTPAGGPDVMPAYNGSYASAGYARPSPDQSQSSYSPYPGATGADLAPPSYSGAYGGAPNPTAYAAEPPDSYRSMAAPRDVRYNPYGRF